MKTKNKLIIAFSALGIVAVAAVVALVAVLANQTQAITSNITVTYTATDITGTASASFQRKNVSSNAVVENSAGNMYVFNNSTSQFESPDRTTLNFTTDNSGDDGTSYLKPKANIALSKGEYVEFKYDFTNTGSAPYTASISFGDYANNNVKLYVSKNSATTTFANELQVASDSISIPATGDTTSYYIYVFIDNDAQDVNFNFNPAWSLARSGS